MQQLLHTIFSLQELILITNTNQEELKKEIEKLRDKLNQEGQDEPLSKKEMLEISRKLDELINKYYD